MKKKLFAILMIGLMVAACQTATATPSPDPLPVGQPSGGDEPCAFSWHNEPQPEHSEEVSTAMTEAGFEVVSVDASAFGENCNKGGEVVSFGAISTDYRVEVSVDDFTKMENTAADVLIFLSSEFPRDTTPGPQAGRMEVTVSSGEESVFVEAFPGEAQRAVEAGLEGIELLEAVGYEPAE